VRNAHVNKTVEINGTLHWNNVVNGGTVIRAFSQDTATITAISTFTSHDPEADRRNG
jgi:hypothetical protein